VFLNGVWVGVHREPNLLVSTLRSLRRAVSCVLLARAAPQTASMTLLAHAVGGRVSLCHAPPTRCLTNTARRIDTRAAMDD
jgi:hypothetical protein